MLPRSRGLWVSYIDNFFDDHFFTQSGINLPSDQSPPPMTFPALAIQIFKFFLYCNLLKNKILPLNQLKLLMHCKDHILLKYPLHDILSKFLNFYILCHL